MAKTLFSVTKNTLNRINSKLKEEKSNELENIVIKIIQNKTPDEAFSPFSSQSRISISEWERQANRISQFFQLQIKEAKFCMSMAEILGAPPYIQLSYIG